jgi:putative pyrroloquinoline-quinone binding quinoprotein
MTSSTVRLLALSMALSAVVNCGPDEEPAATADFLWRTPIDTSNESASWTGTPGVDSQRVYVAVGGNLVALDKFSGRIAWETRIKRYDAPSIANVAVFHDRLFVTETRHAISLDASNGTVRWRVQLDSTTQAPETAADGDAMYTGTRDHRVFALRASDGATLWKVDVGEGWAHLGPVHGLSVSGDTVYVGLVRFLVANGYRSAGVIVALDRNTGNELWRYQTIGEQNGVASRPVVAGRLLIASDALGGSFFAVNRFTGREAWRVTGRSDGVGPGGAADVQGDTVYVASNDKHVYAADLRTGRLHWRAASKGSYNGVVTCRNRLYANNQAIDVIDRFSGKIVDSLLMLRGREFPTSRPATDGERVYVTGTRAIYALPCSAYQQGVLGSQ